MENLKSFLPKSKQPLVSEAARVELSGMQKGTKG